MQTVSKDDRVRVHYTARFEDGTVFHTTKGADPEEVKVGGGKLFPSVEKGLVDMRIGETRELTVPPKEAFGDYREELKRRMKRDRLPKDVRPVAGKRIRAREPDGSFTQLKITEVGEETVVVDGNHPLAGQKLLFEVTLLRID